MKFSLKLFSLVLSVMLCVSCLCLSSAAAVSSIISPALSVISSGSEMAVTGMSCSDASFSASAFDLALGCTVDRITVLTLPEASSGTLYVGDTPVLQGQSISRRNLSKLRFKSSDGGPSEASFFFTPDGSYAVACRVRVIDTVNFAPTISAGSDDIYIETMRGVSVYGSISAHDPEGGALKYYLTESPKKGELKITNASMGDFVYTPEDGKRGSDSFTIRAVDEFGNWSEAVNINIKINKSSSNVQYSDMKGHWAYNAALKMTDNGIMGGAYVNGDAFFYPEKAVSREEFVVMLMKTIGLSEVPAVSATVFADDADISAAAKSYVAAARKLGFISGSRDGDKLMFNPQATITRAEAAVILQNIIGVEVSDAIPVFADSDSIPAWAIESVCAMRELGIMNGTGGGEFTPNGVLSRAQTAMILSSVSELVKK